MPYVGGTLVSLFDKKPQAATALAARRMADAAGDRMVDYTVMNTPIHHGNLRTSWYQLPVNKTHFAVWPAWESGVASDVDYAPHVEYGTGLWGPKGAKYPILPKTPGGTLHWVDGKTGEHVFAKAVMHPGSPGQHMVAIAAEMVEHEFDSGLLTSGILNDWAKTIETSVD